MRRILALFTILLALSSTVQVSAQELPRHPPLIPKRTIEPAAAVLAGPGDLAYIAYVAGYQTSLIANLTGKKFTTLKPLVNLLYDLSDQFMNLTRQGEYSSPSKSLVYLNQRLKNLRKYVNQLAAGDIRDLAIDTPVNLPACESAVKIAGRPVLVYTLSNPYSPLSDQDCWLPDSQITLYTALDSILTLLTFNSTITVNGKYLVMVIHVPREAAYPQVIASIMEGKMGWEVIEALTRSGMEINQTVVEDLINTIRNGTRDEALNALRLLNEYAKRGLIEWDVYLKALRLYRERFGTPILTQQESRPTQESIEVNLSSFLENLEDVVKGAEKARLSVQGEGKPSSRWINHPSISPPSPMVILVSSIGLLTLALLIEREKLKPITDIGRIVFGVSPSKLDASTCYRILLRALELRGYGKEYWETPREYLERLRRTASPETIAVLEFVTDAYEREKYGLERVFIDPKECISEARRVLLHGI